MQIVGQDRHARPESRLLLAYHVARHPALRAGDPPVVARTVDGRVVLDLRTVFAEQDPVLLDAVDKAMESER